MRIIALSAGVYRKFRRLRVLLNMGYSDLIDMFTETYKRYRVEELERYCRKLRVSESDVEKIIEITRWLRRREWW